jgi:hypothetical protein
LLGVVWREGQATGLRMDSTGWGSSNDTYRHAHVSLSGIPRPSL